MKLFKLIVNSIFKLFDKVPLDKKLHFLMGYLFASLVFFIILALPFLRDSLKLWEIALLAFFFTLFPAVGKEMKDKVIDKWDIIYTMIGGFFAALQTLLLLYLK